MTASPTTTVAAAAAIIIIKLNAWAGPKNPGRKQSDDHTLPAQKVVMNIPSPLQNIFTCHNATASYALDVCSEKLHPSFEGMELRIFSSSFEDRIAAAVVNVTSAVTATVTKTTDSFLFHMKFLFVLTYIFLLTHLIFFAFGIES